MLNCISIPTAIKENGGNIKEVYLKKTLFASPVMCASTNIQPEKEQIFVRSGNGTSDTKYCSRKWQPTAGDWKVASEIGCQGVYNAGVEESLEFEQPSGEPGAG